MKRKLVLINPCKDKTIYGEFRWESLSLAYVAGCTPNHWDVELIDEYWEPDPDYSSLHADLVGLTAFTVHAPRAYRIADRLRARGTPVVMGGIHASLRPEEALCHVDAVYTGECESGFGMLIADLEAGVLGRSATPASGHRIYAGERLALAPRSMQPDRTIFRKYPYEYASVQTSRGCVKDCSFCSVTVFNGNTHRMRSVDEVVAELQAVSEQRVLFVDDDLNGFSRAARDRCLALCRAMIDAGLRKSWVAQVTANFGEEDELPGLAHEAGCAVVLIGFEAVDTPSLVAIRKGGKSQKLGRQYYADVVARLHAHGIAVVGSFIVGIETQNMETVADDILGFAETTGLDGLNPTVFTPLPGTRDFARLEREGRILFRNYPDDWENYNLAYPVTVPLQVTGAGLMQRYFRVLQYFRPDNVERAYWRTLDRVSPEAAWHAYRWNRAWCNYGLRTGLFRHSPHAASYPEVLPSRCPERAAETHTPRSTVTEV